MRVKVLHIVVTKKMSGAEKLAYLICDNLNTKYSCLYVCGGEQLFEKINGEHIKCKKIDFDSSFLDIIKCIKKIVVSENVSIVHAHDNKASIYAYLSKKLFKLDYKIVSHIHNCYTWLNGKNLYKRIDRIFRNRYDLNIACGRLVYDYYLQNAPYINKQKLKSLSNFIDVEDIRNIDNDEVDLTIKKYSIDRNKFIFGFIGRLSEQKGLIPFIQELSKYKDKFKDSIFLIVGSGEEEKKIKEVINKYGMNDLFILTGYQNKVNVFYKLMDVFFLPSLYEGLPMVLLEAMANSKPIISMDVGSVSEVVRNDINGLLVKSGEYKEFIDSLYLLKNNKDKLKLYSDNAFKYVKENYDVKSQIIKVEKLYEYILDSKT